MSAPLRVVVAAPDPEHPGGITAVIDSLRRAGLGEAVELVELPTSAMDSPLPSKLWSAGRALARLALMLARPGRRPDVVHLHASIGGSLLRKLALAWCCRAFRVPYVAQMHSGGFLPWLEASAANRAAARALFSRAAATIVLGERWAGPMRDLGAPAVEVLPNGIAESERRALAEAARLFSEADADSGPVTLLFYGRYAEVKGLDLLGAALRASDRSDYELFVHGNGDREWAERQLRGAKGLVTIGGWLGGSAKLQRLAGADAVLAPSRREGMPMALVEARAAGAPVIATAVGAVAEAVAGYPDALLLPAGDEAALRVAIEDLLDGRWPAAPRAEPGPLPDELRSEHAVGRLLEIYAAVAGRPV